MRELLSIIIIVALVSGCNFNESTYEIKEYNNNIYRINKKTGDIYLLKNDTLEKIGLKTPADEQIKSLLNKNVDLPNLGNANATLRIKYREGNILFSFEVFPYTDKIKNAKEGTNSYSKHLLVNLYDIDSFMIIEIPIALSNMTRIVNPDGKPRGLLYNGKLPLAFKEYSDISYWDVGWNF